MYLLTPSLFIDHLISEGTETGFGRIKTVETPSCRCLLDGVLALVPTGHRQFEMLSQFFPPGSGSSSSPVFMPHIDSLPSEK